MCNKKKSGHTLYEHNISNNKNSRPSNISVVVPASRKSCSVEGHWDCGGNEEKASQDGNGKLKRKEI